MSLPNLGISFQQVLRGNSGAIGLPRFEFTGPSAGAVVVPLTANDKAGNYDIVVRVGSVSKTIPVSQKTK